MVVVLYSSVVEYKQQGLSNSSEISASCITSCSIWSRNKRKSTDNKRKNRPKMENWSRSERSPQEWMSQTCQHVIRDLQQYGICVLDNFMGKERAESIHRSVVDMYDSGVFIEGKTVGLNNSADPELTKNVRNDHIAWVDGTENNCQDIAHLIATVDTIIVNSIQTMIENKRLEKRVIGGRTKAMISCYPGNGSYYVKHVDNPNGDGRFLTTTYYVNKDWDTKIDGGMLRVFPQGWSNKVLDIEPILDRVVFFWSDRRNPHEVQPSFRTRYAITIWYFDAKEREEAKLRNNQPLIKSH